MPKRLLEYLPPSVVRALTEEVQSYTGEWLTDSEAKPFEKARKELLELLDARWRFGEAARADLVLPVAVTLHCCGFPVPELAAKADKALQRWVKQTPPKAVVTFAPKFAASLAKPPPRPKRKPARKPQTTQYRPRDLLSIRLGHAFYAAYVLRVVNDKGGSYPVISFYDTVTEAPFTPKDVHGKTARPERFKDGTLRPARFALYGMNAVPDPAEQIVVVQSEYAHAPDEATLAEPVGLHSFRHFFELGSIIRELWKKP